MSRITISIIVLLAFRVPLNAQKIDSTSYRHVFEMDLLGLVIPSNVIKGSEIAYEFGYGFYVNRRNRVFVYYRFQPEFTFEMYRMISQNSTQTFYKEAHITPREIGLEWNFFLWEQKKLLRDFAISPLVSYSNSSVLFSGTSYSEQGISSELENHKENIHTFSIGLQLKKKWTWREHLIFETDYNFQYPVLNSESQFIKIDLANYHKVRIMAGYSF